MVSCIMHVYEWVWLIKELIKMASKFTRYVDHKAGLETDEYQAKLAKSTTLYIGNMSFYTTEEQIYELFSMAGEVKRVVMGLDRFKKTPCGFCFVEYFTREGAENAQNYVNGTKLDSRIIRTDWDIGFVEGRQYGRGKSGGQVRDEYRADFDDDRGGFGGRARQARAAVFDNDRKPDNTEPMQT